MMISRHKHPPAHGLSRQAGVTLFEILVTMFVLSIALLSLAQLQGQALRFVVDSKFRTHASFYAADLADRMRTNASLADQYTASPAPGACDPLAVSVSEELKCWHGALASSLPSGAGRVISDGDGQYTIEISWLERPLGLASSAAGVRRNIRWTLDLL